MRGCAVAAQKHLAVLNPSKIRVCELLIRYHEEKDDR